MNDFLAANWFSIFTVLCVVVSSAVHYGISKQRNTQTIATVKELKQTVASEVRKLEKNIEDKVEEMSVGIRANASALLLHTGNIDIHVSSILLELLKTRHDFVVQQMADTRSDI